MDNVIMESLKTWHIVTLNLARTWPTWALDTSCTSVTETSPARPLKGPCSSRREGKCFSVPGAGAVQFVDDKH